MAGRCPSWKGDMSKLKTSTAFLWENGPLPYTAGWDDPPDEEKMKAFTDGLRELQLLVPRFDAKFSDLVKVVLGHLQDNTFPHWKKLNLRQKKQVELRHRKAGY